MRSTQLTSPIIHPKLELRNRVVMAPMNRRRAVDGIPGESMITYYRQRAGAGLIITDNTAIAENGGAYLHTPGIYNELQKEAWQKVANAVHQEGGKIFMQLVHAGRIGHPLIQNGAPLIAPSAIAVNEVIRVPDNSHQPMTMPVAIDTHEIALWVNSFTKAAANAIEAGFDGVEIHAAHGFLIDQFINPRSNRRTDSYGGSIENRSRFLMEVMQAVVKEIGNEKTGIRLSPFRSIYDLGPYQEEQLTHQLIMDELQKMDIAYVHFSNAVTNEGPTIPEAYLRDARQRFKNSIILAGGYTPEAAERILLSGLADLVAFGKLYIANPDLAERLKMGVPLAAWDESTFYQLGDEGYIDYPSW
jgi:N-ethylmaleimide reductase